MRSWVAWWRPGLLAGAMLGVGLGFAGCGSASATGEAEPVGSLTQGLGPQWLKEQKLTPPDAAMSCAGCYFGSATALQGTTAVVGTSPSAATVSNSAYVFVHAGETWQPQQSLIGKDTVSGDAFGHAVALDQDTIVVGAYQHNGERGAAYVFTRSGATWTEQQKLTAPNPVEGQNFAWDVAVSGDTALVSTYTNTKGQGRAFIYVRSGTTWSLQQELPSPKATTSIFGMILDLEGDTAVIGSSGSNAFVYQRSGTTWALQQELKSSDGAGGTFGEGVDLSGDTAIVTAASRAPGGAAYVFVRSGTTWTEQQKLTASDGTVNGYFGQLASLDGDNALVTSMVSGWRAYAFHRTGTSWSETQVLTSPDGIPSGYFGGPSAIDGDRAIISAHHEDAARGAVYLFRQSASEGGAGGQDGATAEGGATATGGVSNADGGLGGAAEEPVAPGAGGDSPTASGGAAIMPEPEPAVAGAGAPALPSHGGSGGDGVEPQPGDAARAAAPETDSDCGCRAPGRAHTGLPFVPLLALAWALLRLRAKSVRSRA